ncbi:MAG: biotin--[acetyl-CoA-carboxylase] ligase [Spirochaetales bacterium]|nr:biotin--[acetyl-CoA-carboxylase] ligase [Spirochaetales bacterium]
MNTSRVRNPFPGGTAAYVPIVSSTMDEARRLSSESRYGFVRAGTQRAGRGRLPGRTWYDDEGASLLVTFWFPAHTFAGAPLPMVAGLALVRACEALARDTHASFRHPLTLKWPNDVLCGHGKLAGILCEATEGLVYAGIGVNCGQSSFPDGLRTPPTSIFLETGRPTPPDELLERLATELYALRDAGRSWQADYEARMAYRGQRVSFSPGFDLPPIAGTLAGVDHTGAIVMDTIDANGVSRTSYASGELTAIIDERALA